MRSMLKRQNAGEYNNGLPLMSSNPGAIGRSPYSATLSLSRSRLRTHFSPPAFVQSYRIRIKARARMPSRWGTIFRLVSGRYNSRNLGSLKRVAPLRLSRCCGAPSLLPSMVIVEGSSFYPLFLHNCFPHGPVNMLLNSYLTNLSCSSNKNMI